MSACPGCELLPGPLPTAGTLYIWPPLGHTLGKLRAGLSRGGVAVESPFPDCLLAEVSPQLFLALVELAASELSEVERNECKYLLVPNSAARTLADLGRVSSLTRLLTQVTGRWLVELLAAHRLETHFQPIVSADNPADIFGYECLLRGIDESGGLINPGKLYDTARDAGLLYHLDRSSRLQHIAAIERRQLQTKAFINFNPTSIYDPAFCLKSTIAAIRNTNIVPENLVFEVVESDRVADIERLPKILDYYRNAGFRVALDDVGAGYSSLNLLSMLRPDFIKLDMQLLRGIDSDPYKGELVGKLIESAHNVGIQVIAEGIETVAEWNWTATHGADYMQGYLFGRPSRVPQPSCAAEPTYAGS